jgi:cytoskeletal protein RodZ
MTESQLPSFGRLLKACRVDRGIALETIAARTRIPLPTLEAIEEEVHAALPAEVFVKGFLRAYARQVSADPEEVLHHYQRSRALFLEQRQAAAHGRRSPRSLRRGLRAVLVLILLATALAAGVTTVRRHRARDVAVEPPAATAPAPGGEAAPAAGASSPAEPARRHQLNVQALADTRIKVMIDNQATREASLRAGERLNFEAEKGFNLLLGNPAAVQLLFDGQAVKLSGKGGQALTLQLP